MPCPLLRMALPARGICRNVQDVRLEREGSDDPSPGIKPGVFFSIRLICALTYGGYLRSEICLAACYSSLLRRFNFPLLFKDLHIIIKAQRAVPKITALLV